MGRYHSYLQTAKSILSDYRGGTPFNFVLKDFFKKDKKYGSRDRKEIAQLCYSWLRCSHLLHDLPMEEAVIKAWFLVAGEPGSLLAELDASLNEKAQLPVDQRLKLLGTAGKALFPFQSALSDQINVPAFELSFLQQPNLYARIRPGHSEEVLAKLSGAGIAFQQVNDSCLAFTNTTRLEEILIADKEVVIQDRSSQETAAFFAYLQTEKGLKIWDCCAASGGKSIMAFDHFPRRELTVSDIRRSILVNLEKRFSRAGIKDYRARQMDLTVKNPKLPAQDQDLIIADLPCTGSGTWGRTPEQLAFFKPKKILEYAATQSKILENIWPALKPGGYLLYITCSVFRKENEEQVEAICRNVSASLVKMEYFKGYEHRADTLFGALLQKPL